MLRRNSLVSSRYSSWIIVLAMVFGLPTGLLGQVQNVGTQVSVSGQKQITVKPSRLRLQLPMQAEGRSPKEVVKEIAALKEQVKTELISMNADASSIVLEANNIYSYIAGGNDPNSGGRVLVPYYSDPNALTQFQESNELFRIYVARSTMQADWVLPTDDIDAMSLLPEELKKQIQDRDLQGKKRKLEWTEEEREMADNYARFLTQQRNAGSYTTSSRDLSTDVQVFFVGTLTPEQETDALREAYNDARLSAEIIAKATGRRMGELRSLNRTDSAAAADAQYYVYDQYGNQSRGYVPRLNNREVLSPIPSKLQRNIVINVTYALETLTAN